jgi:DNA-binding MarR family transcriptional regulator
MAQPGTRTFLRDLSLDLTGIAALLAEYAEREAVRHEAATGESLSVRQVEALIAARQARSAALGFSLANPGWSVLLELLRAHLDGRPVRMPRLATEARVTMTTMFRWLERFYDAGLAERIPHPEAERGVLIRLTPAGADAMRHYFTAARAGWIIG